MASPSLLISVFLCWVFCVSVVQSVYATGFSSIASGSIAVEEKIAGIENTEYQYEAALQEAGACDCGPNSKGCKIENSTKICECEYSYRQENDSCKAFCKEDWKCDNGGKCVNETCQCPPGTSGDFCKTVDACVGTKGPLMCGDPKDVLCWYNKRTQEPYCMCRTLEYKYYPEGRKCIECDCGPGNCSVVDGKKHCECNEGTAVRKVMYWGDMVDKCEECNCGDKSDGCSFDPKSSNKVCKCKKGFVQGPSICNECDCGPHGQCYVDYWLFRCNCDPGFQPLRDKERTKLTCEACDCGKNGECSFDDGVKKCECNPGYVLRDGICTACQCYLGNETMPCTFTNNLQQCLCPEGYEPTKFFCIDVNECLNDSNSCAPSTTDCVNTEGSYECVCKKGYEPYEPGADPKIRGCFDIDECADPEICHQDHTLCQNTLGSYNCRCKYGYQPVNTSPEDAGCEEIPEESFPWMTGVIIVGVIIGVCFICILSSILVKKRSVGSSSLVNTNYTSMQSIR